VQLFGTTFGGVIADNGLTNQNNANADGGGLDGAMTGFGLCFGGMPQPLFYAEYTGKALNSSNGISLHDDEDHEKCGASYPGPYVRWQVVRNNSVAGVAASNRGTVNATNGNTTDIVAERNIFDCPPGNVFLGNGTNVFASHSVVRP
jgi:hypothetical protein